MQIKAQIVGGPMDGQTIHTEDLKSLRAINPDGTEMEYLRHQMSMPVGAEQPVFIYAPAAWTPQELNTALLDKFPSRNRRNQGA